MPRRIPTFRPPRATAPVRDESKAERDAFYSSSRWMRLRAAHLAEHPLCERCLADDVLTVATIVHHVEERLSCPARALDPSNLESLCPEHHNRHHKAAKGPR